MPAQQQHKSEPRRLPKTPLKVSELLSPGQVLELDHEGQIYRLRITRNRKLILTK